jgi:hypothetical protein
MDSIYPELALYGSKNECARTATVFFPVSQVCARGVTLTEITKIPKLLKYLKLQKLPNLPKLQKLTKISKIPKLPKLPN